jgi:hypothetical protein
VAQRIKEAGESEAAAIVDSMAGDVLAKWDAFKGDNK